MKKLIITLLLSVASLVAMDDTQMVSGLARFISDIKDKEVEQPKILSQNWIDLKTAMTKLEIQELRNLTRQIQDKNLRKKYIRALRAMRRLSRRLNELEVPDKPFVKSYKNVDQWLLREGVKMFLVSDELKNIAAQTGLDYILPMAEQKATMGKALMKAVDMATTGQQANRIAPQADEMALQQEAQASVPMEIPTPEAGAQEPVTQEEPAEPAPEPQEAMQEAPQL